jgi:hypothetical protein
MRLRMHLIQTITIVLYVPPVPLVALLVIS